MKIMFSISILLISSLVMGQSVEEKLRAQGITLFTPSAPMANYVKVVRTGNLLFVAGHGPTKADGTSITGKVGKDLNVEQGIEAARVATISILSTLKQELGTLDKIARVVKVTGWVNCHSDFKDHPKVLNGCSDLLVTVFGDDGRHARAALGANSLPSNIAVEIEMVLELKE